MHLNLCEIKKYASIPFKIEDNIASYLLVELDGNDKEKLIADSEKIYNLLQGFQCGDVLLAETDDEKEKIWKVRRAIGLAVKSYSVYKEEDTVVPIANLTKLFVGVKK